jgi:hypothetical protein
MIKSRRRMAMASKTVGKLTWTRINTWIDELSVASPLQVLAGRCQGERQEAPSTEVEKVPGKVFPGTRRSRNLFQLAPTWIPETSGIPWTLK